MVFARVCCTTQSRKDRKMKLLLVYSFLLVVLVSLVTANPLSNHKEDESERIVIVPRETGSCNVASDCYPDGLSSVPITLIDCIGESCFCDQCFTRNSTGQCGMTVPSPGTCYYYDEPTRQCVDNRKSQVVAFVLSLTLSGLGVANFYIGQNGLGAGQLILFLSIFVIICCTVCIPICGICCLANEDIKGSIVFICFVFLMIILIFAIFFGIWGWWIADAVIFGTNKRDAGDGCPLNPDL